MANLKQSTAFTRTFLMVDSADHVSPKTGLTVGVWLSKAGAAFTAVSGSVSEISFGWYKVALNATDTNTLGDLAFHCTGTAADLTDFNDQVTANILGDTLPANVTQWVGVAPNALISGTVDGNIHYPNPIIAVATGTVSANVIQWKGATPNDLITGTVDGTQHYPVVQTASITGTANVNVVQWASQNVPTPDQTGVPKVNVTNWLSGSVSNPNLVGVPKVDLIDIDGLATSGNNATFNLKQLNIVNSSGDAILAQSTGGAGNGINVIGIGSGSGIRAYGVQGDGISASSGFGEGIRVQGGSAGAGLWVSGGINGGLGVEIYGDGPGGGNGMLIQGGYNGAPALLLVGGNSAFAIDAASGGISADITGSIVGNIYGDIYGRVGWVTGTVQDVLLPIDISAASLLNINAEVVDVLDTDTYAEPGQEAPGATVSLAKKISYLYKFLRNKITQDSATLSIYADDGTTIDQKATVSDDGSTYTRGEIGSGP